MSMNDAGKSESKAPINYTPTPYSTADMGVSLTHMALSGGGDTAVLLHVRQRLLQLYDSSANTSLKVGKARSIMDSLAVRETRK